MHPSVIYTLTSGRLFCDFADLHKAIETISGGPVWTHGIPKAMEIIGPHMRKCFASIASEVAPDFADDESKEERGAKVKAFAKQLEDKHGAEVEVLKMDPSHFANVNSLAPFFR